MVIGKRLLLTSLFTVHLFTLILYLNGALNLFHSMSTSLNRDTVSQRGINESTAQQKLFTSHFDRVVIMLVDALRTDFVFTHSEMEYVRKLLDNGTALPFVALAPPPTVTMPRIKSITSGTVPGFIDILLNLATSELKIDNILSRLNHQGRKIVFYGDETWLKLFPHEFLRHEGTTSFYVNDYTEVDHNVTRHITSELSLRSDWSLMILHYLGLDHIGHLAGPTSPLVGPKLAQMDGIFKHIHESLARLGGTSLLVLCGDHGMSDSGSHGGASRMEVSTPLLYVPVLPWTPEKRPRASLKSGVSLWPRHEVHQVSLATTLALLLGVEIPGESLGQATYPLLQQLLQMGCYREGEVVRMLRRNAHHLKHLYINRLLGGDHRKWAEEDLLGIKLSAADEIFSTRGENLTVAEYGEVVRLYVEVTSGLHHTLLHHATTQYDMYALILASALTLLELVTLLLYLHTSVERAWSGDMLVVCGVSAAATFTSLTLHTVTTDTFYPESSLASLSWSGLLLFAAYIYIIWFLLVLPLSSQRMPMFSPLCLSTSGVYVRWFLIVFFFLHSASLLSSSFVEEEQQTWYYGVVTLTIVLWHRRVAQTHTCTRDTQTCTMDTHTCTRDTSRPGYTSLQFVFALAVMRILRYWNQTGVKWLHRPDVGDWLYEADHSVALAATSLLALTSFLVLVSSHLARTLTSRGLVLVTLSLIFLYRLCSHHILPPPLTSTVCPSSAEAVACWVYVSILFQALLYTTHPSYKDHRRSSSLLITLQLILLLNKPHNWLVLTLSMWCEVVIRRTSSVITCPLQTSAIYTYMASAAFYYQGNSNNFNTVDVSSAYVGQTRHVPLLAGALLTLHTYGHTIYWYMALILNIQQGNRQRCKHKPYHVICVLMIFHWFPITVYQFGVLLQRYHLFIWSVFLPKLLYQHATYLVLIALSLVYTPL